MSSIIQRDDNIPLADDDPQVIISDEVDNNRLDHGRSMDSLPSSYTGSSSPGLNGPPSFEPDSGIDEQEEKARLISQVLELQNTLDDLSQRVDSVKEENLKLRSENQVLGQYIENLMSASSVFQSTTSAKQ
ncbi:short coiled-coil protein homolog [Pieris brassicae]|uniref:Short coiled-coil protein A n=1 Tax=Pieris brassicae TaxID=7116 RepID=A0A9P0TWJ3_PIEBR|nr:short coiled-coil protein homolog [Pieris brassicae]CAH4034758.1 unnamed protein product [Pieris brassicae]